MPRNFLLEIQEKLKILTSVLCNHMLNKTYTHVGIFLYKRRGDMTDNC